MSVIAAQAFGLTAEDEIPAQWPVTVFRIAPKPALVVPAAKPAAGDFCLNRSHDDDFATYRCTRRWGHGGRHANLIHGFGGVVRAVWGPKPLREVTG